MAGLNVSPVHDIRRVTPGFFECDTHASRGSSGGAALLKGPRAWPEVTVNPL
jgi:hypothetical protein